MPPAAAAWPTSAWPEAKWAPAARRLVQTEIDRAFDDAATVARLGPTTACALVHDGRLVLERYADGVGPETTLPSWSMAKSILHATVGLMVGDGLVTLDDPIVRPEWPAPGQPGARPPLTIRAALQMRDGLAWNENYGEEGSSDVQEMLWGAGKADTAAYVAARPVAHPPGTTYGYSSGTSNLLSWHVGQVLRASQESILPYLQARLFAPLGMRSATPKLDAAGTWVASTYCFATAPDFLRFGLLYLRDGTWQGRRLLPEGWVEQGTTPQPGVDDEGWGYGLHWWTLPTMPGAFFANGYAGQFVFVVPQHDLIVLRLGSSPPGCAPAIVEHLRAVVAAAVDAAAGGAGQGAAG